MQGGGPARVADGARPLVVGLLEEKLARPAARQEAEVTSAGPSEAFRERIGEKDPALLFPFPSPPPLSPPCFFPLSPSSFLPSFFFLSFPFSPLLFFKKYRDPRRRTSLEALKSYDPDLVGHQFRGARGDPSRDRWRRGPGARASCPPSTRRAAPSRRPTAFPGGGRRSFRRGAHRADLAEISARSRRVRDA